MGKTVVVIGAPPAFMRAKLCGAVAPLCAWFASGTAV